ncbi:OmpW family outer membrane protein [uncultured Shimia sp.]|uniref:OmpW/AlkL family protein n=1 Tax=uncultured Shimia sp. TaxID=573152 RepID=UPI002608562E|nr:OmpW family outer membrane protein [uncultured Shimia sp.]
MFKTSTRFALSAALIALAAPLAAQSQGDWTLGVGVINVNPKSDNGSVGANPITIDDDTQLSLTVEYFIRDNLGIELLAATPFSHDVSVGGTPTFSTKHLPPTLSLNYHFDTNSNWRPFIGAGINYTTFFEETGGFSLKDSWGLAATLGIDYKVKDNGALRFEVRYMDIDTDVYSGGAYVTTAEIDPIVLNFAYVHRF